VQQVRIILPPFPENISSCGPDIRLFKSIPSVVPGKNTLHVNNRHFFLLQLKRQVGAKSNTLAKYVTLKGNKNTYCNGDH